MFVHTGDYHKHSSTGTPHATYFTFTPRLLMDGNFFTMNDELAASLTDANRTLGFLGGLTSVSEQSILSDLILFQECCFSKMIDYPSFCIQSILVEKGKGTPNDDVQNILSAYRYAMETTPKKISYTSIANYVLCGNDLKQKISIRTNPLFLTQSSANFRQYNPTYPQKIRPALYDISKYIEFGSVDTLIKTALSHYQFEIIHPYEYFNGIVGRILAYHVLVNAGFGSVNFLSLSTSLYRHKAEYFDKLGSTQKNGNFLAWIEFFIHIVKEAAQNSIEFVQYYNALSSSDEERIRERYRHKSDCVLDVYRYFKKNIVSNIRYASQELQMSFTAISRSVTILRELGILTQISGNGRSRVFAHIGLMERLISPD